MIRLGVQATGFTELSRDVRRANKGLQGDLRKKMAEAGKIVADDWKQRTSWSSRIPGSIRVSSTVKGVKVVGGGAKAPHTAALEGGSTGAATFRHPVFGHVDRWVAQQARPSALLALEAKVDEAAEKAAEALDEWAAEAGFR